MAGVRSMLARVRRLEAARLPVPSPFALAYGSDEAFCDEVRAGAASGTLDAGDAAVVLQCLGRWARDGVWGAWHRDACTWQMGATGR